MKPILQQLYEHYEHPQNFLEGRKERLESYFKSQQAFIQSLSPEQQIQFIRLWDQMTDELPHENCEAFICAFQFGARLMLEILSPIETKKLEI